jgi:predicted PolB exonuclease-like 3'-5' exonuclease
MTAPQLAPARTTRAASAADAAYLVIDTESIPDGRLIQQVKYPDDNLSPEDAVARATVESRESLGTHFLPVTFQVPVAVCVVNVAPDLTIQRLSCLDAPHFRQDEIARKFWKGVAYHRKARLITFNGRGFDLPLLELAAFRHAVPAQHYFTTSRNRFAGNHIDLCDWLSNFGACRLNGGLNLLAKLLGKPGKMSITGERVYALWRESRLRDINDYCLCDALDTYFVFLRTRVMMGDLPADEESFLLEKARVFLQERCEEFPVLKTYLENWQG